MDIAKLIAALLPVGEEVAMLFIHNPASVAKFTAIVGTVNSIAPVVIAGVSTAAAHAPAFIPAGVPEQH